MPLRARPTFSWTKGTLFWVEQGVAEGAAGWSPRREPWRGRLTKKAYASARHRPIAILDGPFPVFEFEQIQLAGSEPEHVQ
jgi:hypothetical protein